MPAQTLEALLIRWQALREQGQTLSAAELCRDCPELRAEVEAALPLLSGQLETLAPVGSSDDQAVTLMPTDANQPPASAEMVPPTLMPSRATAHGEASTSVSLAEAHADAAGLAGYEILGELGRGGMGVVYKARQRKANRLVALKEVLLDSRADPDRFRLEAEAIAKLQHPNVVQVFEVGEHHGRPFFSLEFCAGGSLEKKLNGTPLEPGDSALLVESLARAMHHAHSHGVIHRDLKPANVLLTEDGTPKITDFGLAKFGGETAVNLTQTGAVMGTPSYMPPEQARGDRDVGPLADVYSLGAVLYDCLTGRPPFKAASTFDTLHQVIHQEPVAPRQLNARVPRDLETICLKALHKDPQRRYASAVDLADDLRRFLDDKPILARPVSRTERAYRWGRRNPSLVALTALVALALASGTATSLFYAFRAEKKAAEAADNARTAEKNEEKAKGFARLAGRQRNLALESYHTLIGEVEQNLRDTPEMQQIKQGLLRAAVDGLARLDEGEGAPDEDLTLAETYRSLAEALTRLGDRDAAKKAYRAALRIAGRQADASPDDERAALMRARVATYLARLYEADDSDGLSHAEVAVRHAQALADRRPAPAEAGLVLVTALLGLGEKRLARGEAKPAEQLHAQALDQARALVREDSNDRSAQLAVATALGAVATARGTAEDWKSAAVHWTEAVAILRRLVQSKEDEESVQTLAEALTRLGLTQERLSERDQAAKAYDEAQKLYLRLISARPFHVRYRQACLENELAWARLASEKGEHGRAREWLVDSLLLLRKGYPDHERSADYVAVATHLHAQMAAASRRVGGKLAARNHLREAVRLNRAIAEANPKSEALARSLLDGQIRLAEANADVGQLQSARSTYSDALKTARRLKSLGAKDAAERESAVEKKLAALPKGEDRMLVNSIGMDLVRVPAGKYRRGGEEAPEKTAELFNSKRFKYAESPALFAPEHPAHEVTISKGFSVGAAEVTRGQFAAFVKATGHRTDAEKDGKGFGNFNPNAEKALATFQDWRMAGYLGLSDDHPVAGVSWNDAVAFCAWLSKKEGKTYRLPTEAEWEYAARGGTRTRFINGDDPQKLYEVANVPDVAYARTWNNKLGYESVTVNDGFANVSPVGSFRPNAWGLYDVHGNVWEWCSDGFDPKAYSAYEKEGARDPRGPDDLPRRAMRGGCFM